MENKRATVVSISMMKLQIYLFLATIALILGVLILHAVIYGGGEMSFGFAGMLMFFAGMILIIILHEAIHLAGFRYIGKVPWKELDWGVNWKIGAAYAHAKQPVTVQQMKKVLLLPFIPTGLGPLVLGIVLNMPGLSILGAIMTVGCIGDLALFQKLLKFPKDALVIDHPTKPQFTIYE
ncbi:MULTISPECIES: DUF3267 domain-containing protein [unclassified Cytobacillus]|uniref:DUF3267 domain-containing protein n=1 Tax=unclassified Cytobacillus TaxID=2675268 RepID=UPI001357AC70|nr:DUF3267 domain-containing protein [Cytobacillus sp. AMY 15.2]KAF0821139.1 hypothetical protein KIS4809_0666 [Bacillus sp. ZZV12-4809]MCM3091083.1 DUF3267 domain-containing protein [Cytobacillus sp. AMY 15.2]